MTLYSTYTVIYQATMRQILKFNPSSPNESCNKPQTVFAIVLKNMQPRGKMFNIPVSSSFFVSLILARKNEPTTYPIEDFRMLPRIQTCTNRTKLLSIYSGPWQVHSPINLVLDYLSEFPKYILLRNDDNYYYVIIRLLPNN